MLTREAGTEPGPARNRARLQPGPRAGYVISVCLFVHILSAFVLGGLGADSGFNEDLMTTAVIAAITLIGVTKARETLDVLEAWGLYALVVLLLGFAQHDWGLWRSDSGIPTVRALDNTP